MFNYIPTEIIILSAGSAESIKEKKKKQMIIMANSVRNKLKIGTVETNLSDLYIEVT